MIKKIKESLDIPLLMRIMRYAKPYRKTFVLTFIITVLVAVVSPLKPMVIMRMVNNYIVDSQDEKMLLYGALAFVFLLILESVLQFYQTYKANWLGQYIIKDIRVELYNKITSFKLKYFDTTPIGRLVTRAVSDIETIAEIFSQGILIILGEILQLIVVILFMLYINWELTLIVLFPIPLLLIATRIFKNVIKKAYQQVRQQVAALNTFVQERITGMSILQIFNREKIELARFKEINEEHKKAHVKSVWAYSIFFPVVEILSALSIAALIFYGVLMLKQGGEAGKEVFGQMFAFILYVYMLYRPIRQLADRFNTLQMGMVGAERVFNALDTGSAIEDSGDLVRKIEGEIEFKNVWFAYKDEDYVLKDISFQVKKGQTIALVGATGAGKSSVINLLSRFYEYQQGEITVDGIDLREYSLSSIRDNISVVLQDVFLFSDTIHNNITLFNPNITREQVIEAAKIVGAHQFIVQLPGDYDFDVKERGGMLSVGQRQLLAFIRAYVHNPSVLVLDEATSSVDSSSEMLIQKAIDIITENRTSIVIAHRLSTIKKADSIIVIDKGRVVEQGAHQELLQRDGAYKQLHDLQFNEHQV
jgi:ATP-binding cassette, subfamily B, multidrug efflux pump